MYAFCNTKGFSKSGTYTENGNADGPFIYTGFRPAYVFFKQILSSGSWWIFDNKRYTNIYNPVDQRLLIENNTGQTGGSAYNVDFVSNGFKIRNTHAEINGGSDVLMYFAMAEYPIVSSNSKAGVAR